MQEYGNECPKCGDVVGFVPRPQAPADHTYSTDKVGSPLLDKLHGPRYHGGLGENLPQGEGRLYVERRTMEKYGVMPEWRTDYRKLSGKKIRVAP